MQSLCAECLYSMIVIYGHGAWYKYLCMHSLNDHLAAKYLKASAEVGLSEFHRHPPSPLPPLIALYNTSLIFALFTTTITTTSPLGF